MSSLGIFKQTSLPVLRRVMDLCAWRQRVYSTNVANAVTPGYARQEVGFSEEMNAADEGRVRLQATHRQHVQRTAGPGSQVEIFADGGEGGEQGVDLEQEMVLMAKNQMRFNLAARLAALREAGLRATIRGGS